MAHTTDATDEHAEIREELLAVVRQFRDKEIIPNAQDLEHSDTYPQAIVDQMREMGLFGLMVPEEQGGLGLGMKAFPGQG